MKGPKAILSSSIATALDEFFEVDKNTIESNLLVDAQIALNQVALRPRATRLPNANGNLEGHVEKAVFSWKWGLTGEWVQDATLTIQGLSITMTLSENQEEHDSVITSNTNSSNTSVEASMEAAAQEHAENPEEIKQQGGIRGYIQNQVQKIMDSVKLRVEDYQLTIVLPSEQEQLVIKGEVLELVSLGRILPMNDDSPSNSSSSSSSLEQEMNLENFIVHIIQKDDNNNTIIDVLDPFSYQAKLSRKGGKRFDRITENLQVIGNGPELKFHLGAQQLKTLSALAVLFMAPPPSGEPTTTTTTTTMNNKKAPEDPISSDDTASNFEFQLDLLEMTTDTTKCRLPKAKFVYCFDGTKCFLESNGFTSNNNNNNKEKGMHVGVSHGLQANLLTPLTVTIGQMDQLIIPHVVKLTKPVSNTKIVKEGQTYSVDFTDPVEIEMLRAEQQGAASLTEERDKGGETKEEAPIHNVVPFPVSISLPHLVITKEEDDNRLDFHKIYTYLNPTEEGTEFAVELGKLQTYLLSVDEAMIAGRTGQPTEMHNFRFSSKAVQVTAGHSPSEWAATFQKGTKEEKEKKFEEIKENVKNNKPADNSHSSVPFQLPNCYVDPLRLTISWKGAGGMAVKDTKVTVKAFQGKPDTNSHDLIKYYAQSCLAHASDFIPNAELFGLNVVDSTMGAFGNFLGMATLGPLGGVAAIGAVDTVKAAIANGKKRRNKDEGSQTSPFDLVRGVAYAIQDTGESFGSNPINWTQGAMNNTGNYIHENKARLGGAGVGGAGMIVGGLLGGPVGAIAMGVASQGIAGKFIEGMDKKKEDQKVEAK